MLKIYEYMGKAEFAVAKLSLALLSALVFVSAVARTMGHPIGWAVDGATFLFSWCVFFGGDIAIRNDKLISIDIIVSRLPKKVQFYLKVINQSIIVLFLAFMVYYGFILTYTTRFRTFQGMPNVSYAWVTVSVPIGCFFMLISTILNTRALIKKGYLSIKDKDITEGTDFL